MIACLRAAHAGVGSRERLKPVDRVHRLRQEVNSRVPGVTGPFTHISGICLSAQHGYGYGTKHTGNKFSKKPIKG